MTLGGRRVGVRRPRMRTADDEHELPVESYGYFADRDTGSALDVGGVDLWTETFGNADHPAILLIGGGSWRRQFLLAGNPNCRWQR
jgi:hypothetical protein